MQLHVQTTEEDYLRFNDYHVQHARSLGMPLRILRLCVPAASVLILLQMLNEKPGTIVVTAVLLGILSVLFVALFPRLLKVINRAGLKRMKKNGGRLPYHPEADLDFGEDAVTETTPDSMFRLKYANIRRVAWNGEDLYLYVNDLQAVLIPHAGANGRRAELDRLLAGVADK